MSENGLPNREMNVGKDLPTMMVALPTDCKNGEIQEADRTCLFDDYTASLSQNEFADIAVNPSWPNI